MIASSASIGECHVPSSLARRFFFRRGGRDACGLAGCGPVSRGQAGAPCPGGRGGERRGAATDAARLLAPSMPPVQKALWLNEQQKEYLQRISDRYQGKAKEAMDALQRLPAEEQRRRYESFQDQARCDAAAVRKQVGAVLTPQQLQAYEKLDFRLRVPAALGNPQLLRSLGLSRGSEAGWGRFATTSRSGCTRCRPRPPTRRWKPSTPSNSRSLKKH